MFFKTQSGTLYEVDNDNKRIRRVSNTENQPGTPRTGSGEWRSFDSISNIEKGSQVVIIWNKKENPLLPDSPNFAIPTTITNIVIEVEN